MAAQSPAAFVKSFNDSNYNKICKHIISCQNVLFKINPASGDGVQE